MYVENASRAMGGGFITVDNLEPNPKNPIIAAFFRNIGYADQLGSGVRNLFKYSKYYSRQEPRFVEGDIFKIIVPFDDDYSYDYVIKNEEIILEYIKENGKITSRQTEELLEVKQRRARIVLVEMVNNGLLEKQGAYKTPVYVINNK